MMKRAVGALCAAVVLGFTGVAPAFASTPFGHMTAAQVAARTYSNMSKERSFHVFSTLKFRNQESVLSETITQQGCMAWESIPGLGGSVTLLIVGDKIWMRPSDEMWKQLGFTGSQLASVSGKWIDMTNNVHIAGGPKGPLCSTQDYFAGIPRSGWSMGKVSRWGGQRALALTYAFKKELRVGIEVTATAHPLLLSEVTTVRSPHLNAQVRSYYGNFNAPVTLSPPAPSDVLTSIPTPGPGGGASGGGSPSVTTGISALGLTTTADMSAPGLAATVLSPLGLALAAVSSSAP